MLEYLQVAVMIGQLDDPRAVIFIVRHLLDLFAAGLDQGIEVERLLIRVKAVVVSKGQAGIKCVDETKMQLSNGTFIINLDPITEVVQVIADGL